MGRGKTQAQEKRAEASGLDRRCRLTLQGAGNTALEPQASLPLLKHCPEPREQLWGRPLVGGLRCQARSQTLPEQGH